MLEAVIFDWAGTLSDFGSRAPLSAFVTLFENNGVEVSLDEARGPMGTEKKEHVRRMLAMPRIRAAWRHAHGSDATEGNIDELYRQLIPIQRAAIARHSTLVPGALESYRALRDLHIKIGSTTGYGRAMVGPMLERASEQGLATDCVVTSDEVPRPRPSPAGALKNAIELGVSDVRHCLKVDDTQPGIDEGRSAGMWTAVVVVSGNAVGLSFEDWSRLSPKEQGDLREQGYRAVGRFGAHFEIDSVADLPQVVADINRRLVRGERP
jgi:phosphonoacetaldehyde hydrolase